MRRNILILTVALVAAACGGADTTSNGDGADESTTSSGPLEGPDEVYPMLTIEDIGGFVPVQFNLKRIPRYVIMSDGTVYMQAPITQQFPGPAVLPVQVGSLEPTALEAIRTAIESAGLDQVDDEVNNAASAQIADATTTVATFVDSEGTEHRYGVYALGMSDIDYDDDRVPAFESLLDLVDGAAMSIGDTELWEPEAIEVFVSPDGLGYDEEFANTMDYPLGTTFEELPVENRAAGYRCTTLEGADADQLLDTLSQANEATTFVTESGDEYSLVVRPLLPGREGC